MAKKNLPDDETVLKHLLTVAKDCLDFMEPAVRELEFEKREIESAVLEERFDASFFDKVHEALADRLAKGGPSYDVLLPHLESGKLRRPLESVERAKKKLGHRVRTEGGTAKDRRLVVGLSIRDIFEKVGAARATVEAVQDLQRAIIKKLDGLVTQPAPLSASTSPSVEPISSVSWFHDQAEEPPPHFSFGSLEGSKAELRSWVELGNDTFDMKCREGKYWVRRIKRTRYEIWFRSGGDFRKARARHDHDVEQAPP